MRRDHKPFWVKNLSRKLSNWYFQRFVVPAFDDIGEGWAVLSPRNICVSGNHIVAGRFLHLIANCAKPIKLTTWRDKTQSGAIAIGDYCLISPGVEITAAKSIIIGNNCMLAADVSINDSDWHGLYNRLRPFRCTQPVSLADNVWVGAKAVILKGVNIGENAIVGAGAVVTRDVSANTVVAGNPAKVVKQLNPRRKMLKREYLFRNGADYWESQSEIEAYFTLDNSLLQWVRVLTKPTTND